MKFDDAIEEKMRTLDTINLFELPKNILAKIPNTDSGDDYNSLVMGDKNLDDIDAIDKCTRSISLLIH